jgi:hypothetical protein
MTAPHIATAKSLHMRADCHGPDLAASNPATWERRLVPVIRRTLESGLLRGYSHCGKRGIWARFATIEWNPEPATVLKKNYVYFRLLIFFLQEHTLVKLTFESQHEAATKKFRPDRPPPFFSSGRPVLTESHIHAIIHIIKMNLWLPKGSKCKNSRK